MSMEQTKKLEIKRDRYLRARGGWAEFYDIRCSKCSTLITVYQKDGPGGFLRLYFNRFFSDIKHGEALKCSTCNNLIGTRFLYSDGRDAYRLIHGTFSKNKHG